MKKTLKTIFNAIAVMAILSVFVTNIGKIKSFFGERFPKPQFVEPKSVPILNYHLEAEIRDAMNRAHNAAYNFASAELDKWTGEMLRRADDEFLDDYFGFLQTKKREAMAFYNVARHAVLGGETADEVAIRELEDEISRKIIKPEWSQKRIENITNKTIDIYMATFDNELVKLQNSHGIPTPQWNKYISALCGLTLDSEKNTYPFAFKAAFVSGAALSAFAVVPIVKKVATKVSTKIAERVAAKAGAKIAVKAGGEVATKTAGVAALRAIPYVGWGITAAICIWDIADYAKTSSEGKEMLRKSLEEYFAEIKEELLGNTEQSVMGSVCLWENSLKAEIAKRG